MKSHTSEFKEEIKTLGKQQSVRITYTLNNEQIILTDEDINSATPNYEASLLKSVMKVLELDSNVSIPKGTEIKFEYGLLVNGAYEYLDYGNYIVAKEPEKQEDTLSYKITCYDKLLYSMKDYEHIDITYPCTIKQYLVALCNKIGLQFKDSDFANANRQITNELFMTINEDGTYSSMGYTYRDVLDQIAETTGGCICMTLDDKVEVRYINELYNTKSVIGNSIHITDSTEEELTIAKINGNQYQATREGYNFLKVEKETTTANGITFTINQDGSITCKGTATATTTLYFKSKNNSIYPKQIIAGKYKLVGGTASVMLGCQIGSVYYNTNSVRTIELTEQSSISNAYIQIANGKTVNNETIYPLLYEYNNIDKPYEQYGVSPSLDYPSEVKTVGSNVNYFDKDNVKDEFLVAESGIVLTSTDWKCTDYIEVLKKQYYFSWESESDFFQTRVCFYDKEKTYISGISLETSNTYGQIINIIDNAKYIKISYSINVSGNVISRDKIKLEVGNKRTLYSSYMCGSVEINVINKNLFDKNTMIELTNAYRKYGNSGNIAQLNGFNGLKIPVKHGRTYILSTDATLCNNLCFFDKDMAFLGGYSYNTSFTAPNNCQYVTYAIANNYTYIQFEEGTTSSDYVEHEQQTAIMPVQQEMLEGDYISDVEHHEWQKFIFDGVTNRLNKKAGTSANNLYYTSYISNLLAPTSNGVKIGICSNCFKSYTADQLYGQNLVGVAVTTGKSFAIGFGLESSIDTLDKANEKLKELYDAGTPIIIYYKLAKAIDLELTSEQKAVQNQKLYIYKNITNIAVSNELASLDIIYSSYSKETINEEYINDTNVNFGEKYRADQFNCACKSWRK